MTDQLFDVAPKLTANQSLILELARTLNEVDAVAAGYELHAARDCQYCQFDLQLACQYAEQNGRQVLEALRKKGLLKRDRHHVYRRVDGATSEPPADPYDPATAAFPEGF